MADRAQQLLMLFTEWTTARRDEIKLVSRGKDPSYGENAADTDRVGFMCAAEFGRQYGLPFDWKKYDSGDSGIDFTTPMHCERCAAENPGRPPEEWAELETFYTRLGTQIFCKRHGLNLRKTIQLKGFRKPGHQLVKEGHVVADFFVLAAFFEPCGAEFLRWTTREHVLAAPVERWPYKDSPRNHKIPRDAACMWGMRSFREMLMPYY